MKTLVQLVITLLAFFGALASLTSEPAHGAALPSVPWYPGFVIRAEDRFDPAIQRLMAEHSLRLLPLERGQLYYVYPIGVAPRLEGMQIRYLELLLEKQAERESAAGDADQAEEQ
jgi:hypothetical protein